MLMHQLISPVFPQPPHEKLFLHFKFRALKYMAYGVKYVELNPSL